jgi:hypothetical protein
MQHYITRSSNIIGKHLYNHFDQLNSIKNELKKVVFFYCFFFLYNVFTVNAETFTNVTNDDRIQASTFTSVTDGDWNSASTWNRNAVPDVDNWPNDKVIINHAVTKSGGITMNGSSSKITINDGGSLSLTGTLNVGSGKVIMASGSSLSGNHIYLNTSGTCGLNGTITSTGNMDLDGSFNGSPTIVVGGRLLAGVGNNNQIFTTLDLQVSGNMTVQNANFRWSSGTVTVGGNFLLLGSGDVDVPNGGNLDISGTLSVSSNLTIDGPTGSGSGGIVSWGVGNVILSGNNEGLNNCPLPYASPFDLSTCSQGAASDGTAPSVTSGATGVNLIENSGAGQTVYTITATDAVGVDNYAIGGTDASLLSVNSSTGLVSLTADPDYETKSNYSFTVTASDAAGNTSAASTITFSIIDVDEIAPVITLLGDNPATIELGNVYSDAGATAVDNTDGNLTNSITTTSNVDVTAVGSYTVTYNVSDAAGNAATSVVRTVSIVLVAPEITVNGNSLEIIDGDNTPSSSDNTNFGDVKTPDGIGGSATNIFTILNTGNLDLLISGAITSSDSQFSITQPSSLTIAPGASDTFTITFDPSAIGTHTSTIEIPNNDSDENPYNFTVSGEGIIDDIPFNCDYYAYLFQRNDIYAVDLASGNTYLVKEDITSGTINGVGYNPTDGFMWGSLSSPSKTIIRIGKDFNIETFSIPELAITHGYIGDVSATGKYYLKSGGADYYEMDVNPNSSNYGSYITSKTLSQNIDIHDWAFNAVDGLLYSVAKNSNILYRINSETGLVTAIGEVPILSGLNYTYGAVYFDVEGRFYISANQTGTVYVVKDVQSLNSSSTIESNLFAFGPASSLNDGARCPTAPVPQEDCINEVDDDGDGLIDCDDPSCSGVAACPIVAPPVGGGNDGGLESNDRLSQQINQRNYLRNKTNYQFNIREAKRITKSKEYKKQSSKTAGFDLLDLIPMDVLSNTEAIESSPSDLIEITNATELLSVDYIRNDETIAVILATKTEDGVYEHTKYICDRLLGAELLSVSTIEIKGQTFIKSIIKNVDGTQEFVLSFSGKLKNNDENFEIESHWNIDKYELDVTFYNFQIWTNSIDDLLILGEETLELFDVQKTIVDYNNSRPPTVFVKKGKYLNGGLDLEIVNTNKTNTINFDAGFKRTESASLEYSSQMIALNGDYITNLRIDTGNIFDIGFRIEDESNGLADDLFMSDGPWGADGSSDGTTITNFEIIQNNDVNSTIGYHVERNIVLEATTSSYVAAYRALTPRYTAVDLSDNNVLEFDASGTGVLEITIIKEGINEWENQFKTTIILDENQTHYAIPLAYFSSNTTSEISLTDAQSMVFTMASDGVTAVDKKLDLRNILFTQNTLSLDNYLVDKDHLELYPNPMGSVSELRFYSGVSAKSSIKIYNILGVLVNKINFTTEIGTNTIALKKGRLSSGVYFIKISNDYKMYNSKKIIIK